MPKVYTYTTKARRDGKPPLKCGVCREDILPGQKRYEYEFRYGGKRVRHVTCGYPKRSELTQSKMSSVYATIEGIEGSWGDSTQEIAMNLQAIIDTVEEVKTEYEEAAENFGNAGPSQEMADELDMFQSTLESALSEVENMEREEDEDVDDFLQRVIEVAQGAVDECP